MELKVDLKKDGELLFVDLQGDLDINSNKEFKEKVNSNLNIQLDEVLKVQENLSDILQRLGGQKNASINENSREQEKE